MQIFELHLLDCLSTCFHVSLHLAFLWLLWQVLVKKFRQKGLNSPVIDLPPGSRGFPLIGETIQFMSAINSDEGFYDFVRVRRLKYGNCLKTNLFGRNHVFVSSIESAKTVLSNEQGRIFTKQYIKSIAELVGSQSLLCASNEDHKLLRSHFNHLFSKNSLSLFVSQFDELVVQRLSEWKHRRSCSVIVLDEALKITFKAICKMLISLENEEELENLQNDVSLLCEAMLAFPLNLPATRFYKGLQARRRIMKMLQKMIDDRRGGLDDDKKDFLNHLLNRNGKSCYEKGNLLTDEQLKDNILTMIIAGQDTTASAITWVVKYLDDNVEVLNFLRDEQFTAAKGRTTSRLTLEDLNKLPYASKVVKESLRMASIVPWLPRLPLEDCKLQGYKIKKGWSVNIDVKSIHFDPALYSEPYKFNPSRFDDEPKAYSFLAFGSGGRTCLGLNLARAMMLVFLHRLITTYRWEVTDKDSRIEKWALFLRLRSGCPIQVMPMKDDFDRTT